MRALLRSSLVGFLAVIILALGACGGDDGDGGGDAGTTPAASTVPTLKGEGFSIAMPGDPKREVVTAQTSAGPVPITAYVTEDGSDGFSMSVLRIPTGVEGDLGAAIKGIAQGVDGNLAQDTATTFQGFAARDARITNAKGPNARPGTVFARAILAEGRVFQMQFMAAGGDVMTPPAAYTAFVASLKID